MAKKKEGEEKKGKLLYDKKKYDKFIKENPDHIPLPGEHLREPFI